MNDLTPIASAVKTVASPPPQAQPAVAEETKAVPETDTAQAVPPPATASKGGNEPGLGEHVDVYDTENAAPPPPAKSTRQKDDDARDEVKKAQLLGHGTGLPQPTTNPPPQELPFLKPLGHPPLGQSIDAKV